MNNEPIEDRVKLVGDNELQFDFDDAGPRFSLKNALLRHPHTVRVDPFPCYSHNYGIVLEEAIKIERAFPLGSKPYYFILPYETTGRVNGWCTLETVDYEKKTYVDVIVLSGKRIPLHPAMTRYLVAHEYGHAVDHFICKRKGYKDYGTTEFDKEYAKMRGIECVDTYGARKWHSNIGEIIANDFRICVGGVERDFWPHDVAHPDTLPKVHLFWSDLMLEFGYES
jgi:hypothetical protein